MVENMALKFVVIAMKKKKKKENNNYQLRLNVDVIFN